MTLREMIEQHPEWADRDIVVYTSIGDYEYIGASAGVYPDEDEAESPPNPVLVFSAN